MRRDEALRPSSLRPLSKLGALALVALLALPLAAAPRSRTAHFAEIDRVALDIQLEDGAEVFSLPKKEVEGRLEGLAERTLREHRLLLAADAPSRLRILVSTRIPPRRPGLRAALLVFDLREIARLAQGRSTDAEDELTVSTWSLTALVFSNPAQLEGCIADAVEEGVSDFALQVTRGQKPRNRTQNCTTLRLNRS